MQEASVQPQMGVSKPANPSGNGQMYRVDNERIERILKGRFIFGFEASDLFILLAALLTLIFLQLQPYAIPYLEGKPMGSQAAVAEDWEPIRRASGSDESKQATQSSQTQEATHGGEATESSSP